MSNAFQQPTGTFHLGNGDQQTPVFSIDGNVNVNDALRYAEQLGLAQGEVAVYRQIFNNQSAAFSALHSNSAVSAREDPMVALQIQNTFLQDQNAKMKGHWAEQKQRYKNLTENHKNELYWKNVWRYFYLIIICALTYQLIVAHNACNQQEQFQHLAIYTIMSKFTDCANALSSWIK